ncbi:hypothetical protein N7462_006919 [Penicillium macrosclerotiorum]|uniref:uncharacterized protein n=1 Tax=Penicillium macrosclerotiorum TaxID=303699 RepID=UPI00254879A3|nr:uncharacterized protein N7462_006919 [Penicillium macrosclerotiorum]KAJ5678675.1 hypothetical protein N7462_006919 [Penicillium macrosclerotiorum]
MQKIIQRTAAARKQAQKKAFRAKQKENLVDRLDTLRTKKEYNKALSDNLKAARHARWEDWKKGDLAPKRDSGLEATTFGALDPALMHPPKLPAHQRRSAILFAPGDRVCVIRGRDQGKINEVVQVNEESETVLIKGINQAEITVPEWAKASMGIKTDVLVQNMPVPMDDVRLVVALDDSVEGTKDHIVQHAYAGRTCIERPSYSKLPKYNRYISGLNIEIPWPTEEEPHTNDSEVDTTRKEVDETTWVPSLDNPPFPSTIIDELRNKFSRFRTRHDEEYVRKKVVEEYYQEYLSSQNLFTPSGEYRQMKIEKSIEARKAKQDEDGNTIMASETTNFIEQFMSQNVAPKSKKKAAKAKQAA